MVLDNDNSYVSRRINGSNGPMVSVILYNHLNHSFQKYGYKLLLCFDADLIREPSIRNFENLIKIDPRDSTATYDILRQFKSLVMKEEKSAKIKNYAAAAACAAVIVISFIVLPPAVVPIISVAAVVATGIISSFT